jgi:hypothetical protein
MVTKKVKKLTKKPRKAKESGSVSVDRDSSTKANESGVGRNDHDARQTTVTPNRGPLLLLVVGLLLGLRFFFRLVIANDTLQRTD